MHDSLEHGPVGFEKAEIFGQTNSSNVISSGAGGSRGSRIADRGLGSRIRSGAERIRIGADRGDRRGSEGMGSDGFFGEFGQRWAGLLGVGWSEGSWQKVGIGRGRLVCRASDWIWTWLGGSGKNPVGEVQINRLRR